MAETFCTLVALNSLNPHEFYAVFLNGPEVTKKSSISAQNTSDFQTFWKDHWQASKKTKPNTLTHSLNNEYLIYHCPRDFFNNP